MWWTCLLIPGGLGALQERVTVTDTDALHHF